MDVATSLNIAWVSLAAALVLFMQAGFCLLECGLSRSKNSINVAIKNLIDLCVCGILFWAVGFGLMFGKSAGAIMGSDGFALAGYQDTQSLCFFLFQLVFCGTATTIISGAVAERMSFRGYIAVAAIVSGLFYPIFGHWAWGGALGGEPGWLAKLGFVDFAGSTVVHSVGGWISLAAVLVIGPRMGRFPRTDTDRQIMTRPSRRASMAGHDLSLATVGVFVLWFGWFGFNGGSTLGVDARVPAILVNTNLAAAAGGLAAIAISWLHEGRPVVSQLLLGVIAGLVAITAGCHIVSPWSSIVIGAVGGVAACGSTYLLAKLRIDDVVGAVPAHAVAGVWGTIALALLAPASELSTGDRMTQFGIQCLGVAVAFVWSFGGSLLVFLALHRLIGLRATPRQEAVGLNYAEHGASTAMIDLAAEMHRHGLKRQFDRPVSVDRHTEAGKIAKSYNLVLKEVSAEISRRAQAERRYRDIVENALQGIFQTTPDGMFQSANPALLELYGDKTLEALRLRTPSVESDLYVSPKSREEFKRLIAESGLVRDFRAQVRRADGSVIWVSESARAVKDDAGRLLYYEGTVIDITDRVDHDRLQRERDFAEAANEAKSQFLARMSHEMRTPLGGVINTLDLITDALTPAQQTRLIDLAKQSSQTLLTLINDVLDLSRIEAGKLEIEAVNTKIDHIARVTIEMLEPTAQKKGLRLVGHISPRVPAMLRLDGARLQQVLVNLIGNAIKFSSGGEILINIETVEPVESRIAAGPNSAIGLRFEVADRGIGIASDRLEKIFEVFTQADRSTTRRFGGSGLGLAICRQLIELMAGKIGVSNRDGGGSIFWFEVSGELVDENATAAMLPNETLAISVDTKIGSGQVVLIVDDNEINRIVASEMVKRLGFQTVAVESGRLAAQELTRSEIAIVLMDCEMSDWDGLETTQRLRKLHRENKLSLEANQMLTIIACTAQAISGDRRRCLDAGMDQYITKPIRREDLIAALRTALRTEAPISFDELLHRCGDDRQVATEVLRTFAKRGSEDVRRIVAAVSQGPSQTSAAAHRIKGAASTLAAHPLSRIADAIEETARSQKPHRRQEYSQSLNQLEAEMNRCIDWIEKLLDSEQ